VNKSKVKTVLLILLNLYSFVGTILLIVGIFLIIIPALPYIYYSLNENASTDESSSIELFAQEDGTRYETKANAQVVVTPTLPVKESSSPKENTLIIRSIGVNGNINEGKDSKKALYRGIWRVPEFGTPINNERSIILAAHRFGYIEWSAKFRKENSFKNLPNLKVGDEVEIIWDQRKFKYKVYKKEESGKINDYSADLIMYTCKYLKSPIRIIVYAKRVE